MELSKDGPGRPEGSGPPSHTGPFSLLSASTSPLREDGGARGRLCDIRPLPKGTLRNPQRTPKIPYLRDTTTGHVVKAISQDPFPPSPGAVIRLTIPGRHCGIHVSKARQARTPLTGALLALSWRTGAVQLVSLAGRAAITPSSRPCSPPKPYCFSVPNQLGVAYNTRTMAMIARHVVPAVGGVASAA